MYGVGPGPVLIVLAGGLLTWAAAAALCVASYRLLGRCGFATAVAAVLAVCVATHVAGGPRSVSDVALLYGFGLPLGLALTAFAGLPVEMIRRGRQDARRSASRRADGDAGQLPTAEGLR